MIIFISIIQIAVIVIICWHYHYYCCQYHLEIMIIIAIIIIIIIIIIIVINIAFSFDYCYDYCYCYFSESRPTVFSLLMFFTINIPFIVFKFTLKSSLNTTFDYVVSHFVEGLQWNENFYILYVIFPIYIPHLS